MRFGKAYNIPTKIQTKVVVKEEREEGHYRDGPEDPEGAEGYTAKDPHFTNNLHAGNGDITTNTSTIVPRNSMFPVVFDANFRDKQLANVSAHWLKPSEPSGPSAMNVGCSSVNNKNGDGKPTTATISASRTNDSVATTNSTTTAMATNNAVYRLGHSATWGCRNCKIKADKWFMKIHDCSGKK